jgi:hypothetical protein
MLDLWVEQALAKDLLLSGEVLRQKWTAFADLVPGVPEDECLNLSNGWLARFKARNGMREFKRHGEAASADPEEIGKERERVKVVITKYGYPLRDIFNMDETGLFYAYVVLDTFLFLANKPVDSQFCPRSWSIRQEAQWSQRKQSPIDVRLHCQR